MYVAIAIAILLVAFILFEYRVRKPDRIVLYESRGLVKQRKSRFYPRHFSLSIPATVHSSVLEINAEVQGKLSAMVRMDISAAATPEFLEALIRAGGWNEDAVSRAAGEFELMLQSMVRRFTEKHEIEELTTEKVSDHLKEELGATVEQLGLQIISINVQSIEPVDTDIADAMRKRESARIFEQTEQTNQKARISSAKARIDADNKIAESEHSLEMKRLQLRKEEESREAELATTRTEDELARRRMQLSVDREEIDMLKNNPELLVLTPQVARLAEASQSLRNAKTVVSLSPADFRDDSPLFGILQGLFQKVNQSAKMDNDAE